MADLGARWEILETGNTVKLYPCCAATHPPLDALIDLARREAITPEQVDTIDVEVDSMTPRLLIYDRPTTGLEAKFSMPFCAAQPSSTAGRTSRPSMSSASRSRRSRR